VKKRPAAVSLSFLISVASEKETFPMVPNLFGYFLLLLPFSIRIALGHKDWTNSAYPDLRGPTYQANAIPHTLQGKLPQFVTFQTGFDLCDL
jgi:hypothetical protein